VCNTPRKVMTFNLMIEELEHSGQSSAKRSADRSQEVVIYDKPGSKKIRVLIIMHGLFPGYVAPIPKEIAKNLFKLGIDIEVAAIGEGMSPSGEDFKFRIIPIMERTLIEQYRKLNCVIREYDIVHYFPGKGFEFLPLFNRKVRFIYNFISVSVSGRPFLDSLINALKKVQPIFADLALYTDPELKANLEPCYIKTGVFPVGFASDLFYPCEPYKEQDKRILIYHGSCHPSRRLEQMIKVMPLLEKRYELIIIGKASGDYISSLKKLSKELGCAERVSFAEMPQNEIRSVIERAYLCFSYVPVIESYNDQFVLKTIEYLACGRPVLSTNTRYTLKFQKEAGERNILVCGDDIGEMAEAINSSDTFVNSFYDNFELHNLYNFLYKYSNESLVKEKLLPYYESILNN